MKVSESDWLEHSGTPQQYDFDPNGSGRYRQGSGEDPYQHVKEFRSRVAAIKSEYKKEHGHYISDKDLMEKLKISDKELVEYLFGSTDDLTIRNYRALITKSKAETDAENYLIAHKLKEKNYSDAAIGKEIGKSASTVASLLKRDAVAKSRKINNVAEMLKQSLEEKGGFIDVGTGAELYAGVSKTVFDAAVKQLESEGYTVVPGSIRQMFGQGNTPIKALGLPGSTRKDFWDHKDELRLPVDVHVDSDGNATPLRPIQNVDHKRVMINYAEDGGIDKDGVIELRRGVKDLDLGNASYAQVRIGVDGTHYLKGMAVYADDLPDGIDIRFNTNKKRGTPMMDPDPDAKQVLKAMADPKNVLNPFGAAIKGAGAGQRGALNIVNEEGDWSDWSKTLSSQFLSKQYDSTISRQLKATAAVAQAEFDEIKQLTNPTIKRYYLKQFADSCESDAVHLKAIRLPGQTQKVLLPLPGNKERECYCPSLPDGTEVALVRYPHGGVFEIPVLTVNNHNKTAEKIFGNAKDAIGIHPSQAGVLSGADFDGDTVMVLPLTGSFKLKQKPPLEGLKGFEPKIQFNGDHLNEKDKMKKSSVQQQMGAISNLITDMTLQGADDKELARAVAHSMVVIDAHKHGLDYKASEKYFDIAGLKRKYQNGGGASTVISSAKSQFRYLDRREKAVSKLTPEEYERWKNGEMIYELTGKKVYSKRLGGYTDKVIVGTKMGDMVSDASELSSGSSAEKYYVAYANQMKELARQARAEMRATEKLTYSPSARVTYKQEYESLRRKLNEAKMNAPLERKAQVLANSSWLIEKAEHPEYSESQSKKARSRHLESARIATGAKKKQIQITDDEWTAIQSGAIHDNMLLDILANAEPKDLRARAMPRESSISSAKLARAKSLYKSGQSWADIAEILGVPVTTLQSALKEA